MLSNMDKSGFGNLKIGQLNLQGSSAATTELPMVAQSMGLDIVLVQEQYAGSASILECGDAPAAGLVVLNPRLTVTLLLDLSDSHCLVAHIVSGAYDFHLVSAYFQYSDDVAIHVAKLERILTRLGGARVLIGVDSNAHSPIWHCERSQYTGRGLDAERRRTMVEGLILERDLLVHNVAGQPPTFHGPNGKSNVDLTLSTRGVGVEGWEVHEGASLSDHQLITFNLRLSERSEQPPSIPSTLPVRFRDRGVDWDSFRSALHARMGSLHEGLTASQYCKRYSEILLRTATECLGKCGRSRDGRYEWWNPELDSLRLRVSRARREWQRSRPSGGSVESELHDKLRSLRGLYKEAMKTAEIKFYQDIAESGNDDPWGLAYREANGRRRPPPNVLSGVKLAEGYTTTAGATMDGLLRSLCPDDSTARDTEYHHSVRVAAAFAPSGNDAPAPSMETIERIIRSLPNTAPGADGITAKIVRCAWLATSSEMWLMYSKCINEGYFPDIWKSGQLIVLPKGNGKPLSDPKAYRPITLLPILGKVLERIILSCAPCLTSVVAEGQHGFTRGRSTVTALRKINQITEESSASYIQLILLDIAGAFDNAWWPMILLKAKQCGVTPNLYRILVSYFSDRFVSFCAGDRVAIKRSTMGCPQGSVLGPTLWNLLINDLLLLPCPEGVHLLAYADDVTIVIEASSRAQIERNAQSVLAAISEWGSRNRLEFSPGKSLTMTYKGSFKRPPTIRMNGGSLTSVTSARVLGVTLDQARSYVPHAKSIGDRAANCFGKMARISATRWGVRYHALKVLYMGTYMMVLTYAAAVWYRRWSTFVVRRGLQSTQRPSLILLTKAYRSCSTAALPVLAGVLPADLEVFRAGRLGEEGTGLVPKERRRVSSSIFADAVARWQESWEASEKGRELYSFFPDLRDRLSYTWVEPSFVVSQILTGHGCFRGRLHRMALCESAMCPCDDAEEETRDHALWSCALYCEARNTMLDTVYAMKDRVPGPVYHLDLVSTPEAFGALKRFAHEWHTIRRSYE